jgi:3-phenylpropionate/trans-cinnamate dioxygenase ferredoxin reductase subunit
VAKGQGRGLATSIVSGHVPYTKLPYFWSDQYDVSLEYRGQAAGDDRTVWRGDPAERKFSVFYLRDGRVDAVLSMNDKETGETGALLIESRREIDDEHVLADVDADLKDLLPPS